MLNKKTIGAFVAAATLISGFAFASLPPAAFASTSEDNKIINFQNSVVKKVALYSLNRSHSGGELTDVTEGQAKTLKSMNINTNDGDSNNFSDLKYFTGLQKVHLWTSGDPTGLDSLKSIPTLESLSIGSTLRKVNISDISDLKQLKSLAINGATNLNDSDVSKLSGLTNLKKITITDSGITKFSSLDFLPEDLEELDVSNTSTITSISGIERFKKLKLLNITDTSVSDLTPVTSLKDTITDLEANTKNGINSIEPLSQLTRLNYLLFRSSNNISSIEKLKSLTGLKTLVITGGNEISDISPVNSMPSLSALAFYGFSKLSDIKPISKNASLKCFSLISSNVSDISVLSSLSKIRKLALVDNKLTDINPIKSLNNLTKLVVGDEIGLDKVSALVGSKRDLSISSIHVGNISPLSIHSWDGFPVFEPEVVNDDSGVTSEPAPAPNPGPAPAPKPVPSPAPNPSSNGEQNRVVGLTPHKISPIPKIEPHKPLLPKRGGSSDLGSPAPKSEPTPTPDDDKKPDQNPEVPQTPQVPNNPETPQVPQNPQAPNAPHAPESPTAPAPATKSGYDKSVNAPVNVPEAPKSVNDLKPEVKGDITVGNNNVAKAGAPNKVTLHVDNAKFNKELKDKGSVKAYAFMYSTPKLLRSVDGSDYVTVKLDANGVPYFDAQFPAGYSGKHTVVLVDEQGNQLAWTDITVENKTANGGEGTLPATGVGVAVSVIAMAVFAGIGVTLRRVR